MAISRYSVDWRRLSRWSMIGAVAIMLWFLWPVAQCSWQQFRGAPLPGVEHQQALDRDDTEREPETGFFATVYDSAAVCYNDQPISSQASWKRKLLYLLLVLALVSNLLHRAYVRRRPGGY